MTAKKNFKRLVRRRARKTGESYVAALRHFKHKTAEDEPVTTPDPTQPVALPQMRRIEKPEYGFALSVPVEWLDEPPNLKNSSWEVARAFATYPGDVRRGFIVFRGPAGQDAEPEAAARGSQTVLERGGFGNFVLTDDVIAGRPAVQLDFNRPAASGRTWSVRHHFLIVGGATFCISFGTNALEEDGALLDALAASFELTGDLARAEATPRASRTPLIVERPQHGFALTLPPGWFERAPNPITNPWEVATFAERGDSRHTCSVARRPRPDRTARELAEEQRAAHAANGFTNIRISDVELADRPAVQVDGEQRDAGRVWASRDYHLIDGGIGFTLRFGSAVPDQDAPVFDSIAASFRLLSRS